MVDPIPPQPPGASASPFIQPPAPAQSSSSSSSTPGAETVSRAPSPPSSSVQLGSRNPFASPVTSTLTRDAPGSSRTRVCACPSPPPIPPRPLPPSTSLNPFLGSSGSTMKETVDEDGVTVTVGAPVDLEDESMPLDNDAPHSAYRSPEPVIEPPQDPPGYIIAEHPPWDEDVDPVASLKPNAKQFAPDVDDESMDVDGGTNEPEYNLPGIMPRRLLSILHDHELYQPVIHGVPPPVKANPHSRQGSTSDPPASPQVHTKEGATAPSGSPRTSGPSAPNTPNDSTCSEPEPAATLSDIWNALPGGEEHHHEWYFCPVCWGWIRIATGSDTPRKDCDQETPQPYDVQVGVDDNANRFENLLRLKQTMVHEFMAGEGEFFHPFLKDGQKIQKVDRISRIEVDQEVDAFPHLTIPGLDVPDSWSSFEPPPSTVPRDPTLFLSSLSKRWIDIDGVVVPGQIPAGLAKDFTAEKENNPRPGMRGAESASEAWSLLSTLLLNPLFRGQWGWVQLENNKFKRMVGSTLASMLYHIGFGCRQEGDGLRIGPFVANEKISKEQARQMINYMLRAWVEISLYLATYQDRCGIHTSSDRWVKPGQIEDVLSDPLTLSEYPKLSKPLQYPLLDSCKTLGVSKWDSWGTIEHAYSLQLLADSANANMYFGALKEFAYSTLPDRILLQRRVRAEESFGRYSAQELKQAYRAVGYTDAHANEIGVEPEDAPPSYILNLHKQAVSKTAPPDRKVLNDALILIGKSRKNKKMIRMGETGQTLITVDEAYSALSAPKDSIDDGLIMQYELAIADFPGKADYYKRCLEVIAKAPGEGRPGIASYLETGFRVPPAPPRKDVPVGLQNIGNTCYLNSILQYLYSIKPVREAVLLFGQGEQKTSQTLLKPEVERSRRFVKQLRLLFLQLYKSELASVRPEEELAYLAITRPEVDEIVEPPQVKEPQAEESRPSVLDSIPDIPDVLDSPSPALTAVASDDTSTPTVFDSSLPQSPRPGEIERPPSVLGKRQSEDRDESASPAWAAERTRLKSEPTEGVDGMDVDVSDVEVDTPLIPIDMLEEIDTCSPLQDMSALKLKSPDIEAFVPPPLPPRPKPVKKPTLASGLQFGLQQDSAEVLINVLTQLEMAFDPLTADGEAKEPNLISDLFSCKYRQQTFYETADGGLEARTPVESVFVHPIIGVEEEGKDLYDCLGELYLRGDEIEYEGKKGYMVDLMDSFPPMLYIQMRRSQYDPKTGRETKTNTHIRFDQTLAMDRFLATADKACREESIEITREISRIRERLHILRNHKPLSIPDTLDHVRDALGHLVEENILEAGKDVTADLMQSLEDEGKATRAEIDSLESKLPLLRVKLDSLWEGHSEYEYELVSVFMHRGRNSGSGHYWTYQSHLPDKQEFFKYNDEEVTAVPASEVLQDRTGSDANPALLCYVRKGRGIVETLHREILEPQKPVGGGELAAREGEGGGEKDGGQRFTKNSAGDLQVEVLEEETPEDVQSDVLVPADSEEDEVDTVPVVTSATDNAHEETMKAVEAVEMDKNQGVGDLVDTS